MTQPTDSIWKAYLNAVTNVRPSRRRLDCSGAPMEFVEQRETDSRTVSQEILSRPGDTEKPYKLQEFVELRIDDWTDSWKPGFAVTEWRIRWSEADQQFMWEDAQQEQWPLLLTAMNRYEARHRSLIEQGFTHSDMDF
jgi:hypothetical protein